MIIWEKEIGFYEDLETCVDLVNIYMKIKNKSYKLIILKYNYFEQVKISFLIYI